MVTSEDFGIARCRIHKERYHVRDYDGEGARGYADASDPMVWSDTQWRSTLFGGYSQTSDDRYDRRFRREGGELARDVVRVERRVDVIVADAADTAVPVSKPRGPKYTGPRAPSDFKAGSGVLRFGGHDCRGVLVLTWGTLGGKSRCHNSDGRVRRN
jgi:hypothetical protein